MLWVEIVSGCILAAYISWILVALIKRPLSTFIGLSLVSRERWSLRILSDPNKAILAVQTLRNSATIGAVFSTLSVAIASVVIGQVAKEQDSLTRVKLIVLASILLAAFLALLQHMRYVNHASFLAFMGQDDLVYPLVGDDDSTIVQGGVNNVDEYRHQRVKGFSRAVALSSVAFSIAVRLIFFAVPFGMWLMGSIPFLLGSVFVTLVLVLSDRSQ